MLRLSRKDIEVIGNSVLADFYGTSQLFFQQIDVDRLAGDYLHLRTSYRKLSDNGRILGLTAFADTDLILCHGGIQERFHLPEDTVLLEERLLGSKFTGRRRFTMAHECAHQILFRMEEQREGVGFRKRLVLRQTYSCRELVQAWDWCEWQANALGAAILMPSDLIRHCLYTFGCTDKLTIYGLELYGKDYETADNICRFLGVSLSSFLIRLKELHLLERRSVEDYHDPLDIFVS